MKRTAIISSGVMDGRWQPGCALLVKTKALVSSAPRIPVKTAAAFDGYGTRIASAEKYAKPMAKGLMRLIEKQDNNDR